MPTKTSSSKSITVSIVSHGQQGLILPLLEQLDRLCAASVAKVVLTVNVPEPELLVGLALSFPIERTENRHPKGFGANHNAAFARCGTEWFLVLNPDMRIAFDIFSPMIGSAQTDDGILAPRIFEPGKDRPEPHRALITPYEILMRNRETYRPPATPAWVPGMLMLFRTQAFRQVRGFDERFFMYGEDFDICARMRLAGWQCRIVEHLQAMHEARRASHRNVQHLLWHLNSLLKVWLSRTFWRYRALYRTAA